MSLPFMIGGLQELPMKQQLINQIKEILGMLVEEVINVDSYLKNKSEQELKIIKKGLGLCVNLKQKEL